jgi:RimJ/RimL family protein N-acetyltransferase
MSIQERPPSTLWVACIEEEAVIGCYSYIDDMHYPVRCIQDFYTAPGRTGKKALRPLWDYMHANSNLDITFVTEPYNQPWMTLLLKHGFEMVGVQFYRKLTA